MKRILLILSIFIGMACSREVVEKKIDVETQHVIILKNKAGQNLLDTNTPNHFSIDDFLVYKLDLNGNKVIVQNNKVDFSSEWGYFIYLVDFGIDEFTVNNQPIVYLQLSKSTIDTIKLEYEMVNGNTYSKKLWYNGELKWTKENDKPIEIIK